jgi:hypothetical protein
MTTPSSDPHPSSLSSPPASLLPSHRKSTSHHQAYPLKPCFFPLLNEAVPSACLSLSFTPGPGEYNVRLQPSGPSFSLYGKLPTKLSPNTPGPGAYKLPVPKVTCTKFSPRPLRGLVQPLEELGPGRYSPNTKACSPMWVFSKAVRERSGVKSETPGPGTYEIRSALTTKGFSMYPKIGSPKERKSPGPGSYSPVVKDHSLKFSMAAKSRERVDLEIPGPGAYLFENSMSLEFRKRDRGRGKERYKWKSVVVS